MSTALTPDELHDYLIKQTIEDFAKVQRERHYPCPRCGRDTMDENPIRNSLSRRADVYICDMCGLQEAMEDMMDSRTPLSEWSIVKGAARQERG